MVIKRHALLLEVLIAIFLVTLCFLPLVTPHIATYRELAKQKNRVLVNHKANLRFAEIYESLLDGRISLENVVREVSCDEYKFKVVESKGKAYLGELVLLVQGIEYKYHFFFTWKENSHEE